MAQDTQNFVLRSAQIRDTGINGLSLRRVDGATLAGIAIDNAGGDGLAITNSNDVTVDMVNIESSANNGLAIGNGTDNVAVSNTVIGDSGRNGILLFGGVTNVTFDNLGVRDAATHGIAVSDAQNLGIRNARVTAAGMAGVAFNNVTDATLENFSIQNVAQEGVLMQNVSDSLVSGMLIANTGADGFRGQTLQNVMIENLLVTDAGTTTTTTAAPGTSAITIDLPVGVHLLGSQNVSLQNVSVTDAGFAGIGFEDSTDIALSQSTVTGGMFGVATSRTTRVTVSEVMVAGTAAHGIADSNSQELVLRDSTVMNAGGNGIFLDGTQNSFLRGLRIANAQESGIHLMNTVNIVLQDTVITSNAASPVTNTGLRAVNSNALQVRALEVSNTTGNGVDVSGVNNDLIDVGVTNAGGSGIRYQGTDGLLSEITVNGAGSFGLLLRDVQNVSVTRSTFSNVSTGVSVDLPIFAGSRSNGILFSDITVENASSNGMALFNVDNVVAEDIMITGQSTNGLLIESTGGESFDGTRITVDAVTTNSALNFIGPGANIQVTDTVLTGSGLRAISLVNSMNIGGDVDVDTSGYATVCRAQPTLGGTITGSLSLGGLNGTTPPATCP